MPPGIVPSNLLSERSKCSRLNRLLKLSGISPIKFASVIHRYFSSSMRQTLSEGLKAGICHYRPWPNVQDSPNYQSPLARCRWTHFEPETSRTDPIASQLLLEYLQRSCLRWGLGTGDVKVDQYQLELDPLRIFATRADTQAWNNWEYPGTRRECNCWRGQVRWGSWGHKLWLEFSRWWSVEWNCSDGIVGACNFRPITERGWGIPRLEWRGIASCCLTSSRIDHSSSRFWEITWKGNVVHLYLGA